MRSDRAGMNRGLLVLTLLAAGSRAFGAEPPLRIVAFGDSTTATRNTIDAVTAQRLPAALAGRGIAAFVINAGIGGDTTVDAMERFERDVLSQQADLVVIQFGINDAMVDVNDGMTEPRVPMARFKGNLLRMVQTLSERETPIVLMTPNPMRWTSRLVTLYGHPPYDVDTHWGLDAVLAGYAQTIRNIAERRRVPLVDVHAAFHAYDEKPGQEIRELLPDGVHPNDAGHALVTEWLADRIAALVADGSLTPSACAPAQPGAAPPLTLVEAGDPKHVHGGERWRTEDGALTGTGPARLTAAAGIRPGDFVITARLRLTDQDNSAAAFVFGDNAFGFEGARGTLFVNGPVFGGLELLSRSEDVFEPEAWFEFSVVRAGNDLRFLINDRIVRAVACPPVGFDRVGFSPMRSTMHIERFAILGAIEETTPPPPRGYDIPIVDLADEEERQVVVDREPGQYLGHPTTVLLEDGATIITVYPKGHGRGPIVMKRSTDGGRTWSERLPVPDNWSTSREVPTIHRTIDPRDGTKRLIVWSGLYPARLAVSEDDGMSWSALEPAGEWGGIVVMGCVERLKNGDYIALFHDDGRFRTEDGERSKSFTLFQTRSRDGGRTWASPRALWSGSHVHLCEPGIIRSPDGDELAILLRENARRRNSHVMFSRDEGRTWSEPRELPGALTGDRHTARYAPDGRLLISFRDTTLESPTQGDWVAWVGRYEDIVEGRSGQCRIRLMDNHHRWDCAYPGVEVLPDGTFVLTTYGHWTKGAEPYIVSVRLTLDEIDARMPE
ncbi:MAG: hypothetical protein HKO59_06525 [Phycisphaerales bacterium]|nr:hypothetical protein [Phycisphaerales bacterium]